MSETTMSPNDMALAQGKTFVWHEVYGAKSEAAVKFYTEALGWESQTMPMGEINYTMLVANGNPVAGVIGTTEWPNMEEVPPHWSTYIGVDDVDARMEKCKSLGASVVHGPMDVPTVGRMVLMQDPQGAHFWLFQPEKR